MAPSADLVLSSYGASDVGRRREVNEDAFLRDDEMGLWIVADGMGGHAAGEVASQESVETIYGMVKRGEAAINQAEARPEDALRVVSRILEGAIQAATYMVFAMAELDVGKVGMGTTISAMLRHGQHLILGQVGDSRVYRLRDGQVTQLTEDHTLVAWQLKHGLITAAEARKSKQKNVITRAVGSRDYVQVDTSVVDLCLGDTYLLCSDGLHGYLKLDEIPALLADGGQSSVQRLIDLANQRGGKDNITAILVEAR